MTPAQVVALLDPPARKRAPREYGTPDELMRIAQLARP